MQPIRVAIADDDSAVRAVLRRYFANAANIDIAGEAADGNGALNLVAGGAGDVLLLDGSMPLLGGLDVLRQIRKVAPRVGVVVLSAYPPEMFEREEACTSASIYLHKTCDPQELLRDIRAVAVAKRTSPDTQVE